MQDLEAMNLAELLVYLSLHDYAISLRTHPCFDRAILLKVIKYPTSEMPILNDSIINSIEINSTISKDEILRRRILLLVREIENLEAEKVDVK